ncbi:hypothetical protein [Marinobacterium aestuariivivens]|uniref:Uncharacterized protein n=1 Tax=Marinobacterium aestuariivivens TaxID=1698799 RepID=A0ABW2A9P5_9GAMM
MSVDLEHLQQWIGKTEAAEEELERWPVAALLAALDVQPEDWPKKVIQYPLARTGTILFRAYRSRS